METRHFTAVVASLMGVTGGEGYAYISQTPDSITIVMFYECMPSQSYISSDYHVQS